MRAWWHSKTAGAAQRGPGRIERVRPSKSAAHGSLRGRSTRRTRKRRQRGQPAASPTSAAAKRQAYRATRQAGVSLDRVTGPPVDVATRYARRQQAKKAMSRMGMLAHTQSSEFLLGHGASPTHGGTLLGSGGSALLLGQSPGLGGYRGHSVQRYTHHEAQKASRRAGASRVKYSATGVGVASVMASPLQYGHARVASFRRVPAPHAMHRPRTSPAAMPVAHGPLMASPTHSIDGQQSTTSVDGSPTRSPLGATSLDRTPPHVSTGLDGAPPHVTTGLDRTASSGSLMQPVITPGELLGASAVSPSHHHQQQQQQQHQSMPSSVSLTIASHSPQAARPLASLEPWNSAQPSSGVSVAGALGSPRSTVLVPGIPAPADASPPSRRTSPLVSATEGFAGKATGNGENEKHEEKKGEEEDEDEVAWGMTTGVLASFRLFNERMVDEDVGRVKRANMVRLQSVRRMTGAPGDGARPSQAGVTDLEDVGEAVDVDGDLDTEDVQGAPNGEAVPEDAETADNTESSPKGGGGALWRRLKFKAKALLKFSRNWYVQQAVHRINNGSLDLESQRRSYEEFSAQRHAMMEAHGAEVAGTRSRAKALWSTVNGAVKKGLLANATSHGLMYVSTIVLAKQRVAYLKKMEKEREALGQAVDSNENYTAENIRKRADLSLHPSIVAETLKFWHLAHPEAKKADRERTNDASVEKTQEMPLSKEQYSQLLYHCLLALTPDMSESAKQKTLEADWKSDSKGRGGLSFKMFHMSLYQLTDMWCDGIDAGEYVSFLEVLLNAIASENEDGELVYRRKSDVRTPFHVKPKKPKKRRRSRASSRRSSMVERLAVEAARAAAMLADASAKRKPVTYANDAVFERLSKPKANKSNQFRRFFGLLVTTDAQEMNLYGAAGGSEGDSPARRRRRSSMLGELVERARLPEGKETTSPSPRPLAALDAVDTGNTSGPLVPQVNGLGGGKGRRGSPSNRRRNSRSDSRAKTPLRRPTLGEDIDVAAAAAAASRFVSTGDGVAQGEVTEGTSGLWSSAATATIVLVSSNRRRRRPRRSSLVRKAAYRNPSNHNAHSTLGVRLGKGSHLADGLLDGLRISGGGSPTVASSPVVNVAPTRSTHRALASYTKSYLAQGSVAQPFMQTAGLPFSPMFGSGDSGSRRGSRSRTRSSGRTAGGARGGVRSGGKGNSSLVPGSPLGASLSAPASTSAAAGAVSSPTTATSRRRSGGSTSGRGEKSQRAAAQERRYRRLMQGTSARQVTAAVAPAGQHVDMKAASHTSASLRPAASMSALPQLPSTLVVEASGSHKTLARSASAASAQPFAGATEAAAAAEPFVGRGSRRSVSSVSGWGTGPSRASRGVPLSIGGTSVDTRVGGGGGDWGDGAGALIPSASSIALGSRGVIADEYLAVSGSPMHLMASPKHGAR